jgi:hypothetical protein
MVTEGDRQMIAYFAGERGDIERWSSWDDRKDDIGLEYPELISALKALLVAERTLAAIVRDIGNAI